MSWLSSSRWVANECRKVWHVADSVEQAGLRRLRRAALLGHRRDAETAVGGQRRMVAWRACLPDGHVLEGNIRDRHYAPQVAQFGYIGRARSVEGRTVAGCQRSWQRSAPMATVRSRFRSRTRTACLPASG